MTNQTKENTNIPSDSIMYYIDKYCPKIEEINKRLEISENSYYININHGFIFYELNCYYITLENLNKDDELFDSYVKGTNKKHSNLIKLGWLMMEENFSRVRLSPNQLGIISEEINKKKGEETSQEIQSQTKNSIDNNIK